MKTVILVTWLVVIHLVHSQAFISNDLVVQTDAGRVKGSIKTMVNNASSVEFLGIPYAKSPVGPFRFRRPAPPSSWPGIRQATTMPKICYPSVMDTSRMVNSYSEDCLYINIYVPANRSSNAALPVFVWVHSDSPLSTMMELSNGNALAITGNFIVVTFDFRQGVLGYLTGIDSSGRSIFTPNLGILDQVMALKWVQRNIANFDGDPKRVTLAGTTTGAFSVGLLFTNSTQQGLYQRIALVSGCPLMPRMYHSSLNATSASMYQFLQKSQCSVRTTLLSIQSCLRNLSIANVLSAQSALTTSTYNSPFKAVIDGNIIKSDPLTALHNNQFDRQIQILASVVRPDSGLNAGNGVSRRQFNQQLSSLFSDTNLIAESAVVNRYTDWSNISSTLVNQHQLTSLYSDYFATAPLVNVLNMISAQGASTFMYEFSYPINMSIDFSSQPKYLPIRSEISYLFGYPILQPLNNNNRYSSNDLRMSHSLIQFWSSYVYNGNPASNNRLAWPKYSSTSKDYLKFTLAPQTYTSPRANYVAFWNNFFPLLTTTQSGNCSQSTSPIVPPPKTCAHPAYIAGTYVQFGLLCAITISIVIYCIVRYRRRPSKNLTQLTTNTKEEDENL